MGKTGDMAWDNLFDLSDYKKRRMEVKTITYDLCTPDCPYYHKKKCVGGQDEK